MALDKGKFLTKEEREALEATLERNKETSPRDVALIGLGLATGGRASELLALTKGDLSARDKSVHIAGLKGSKDRDIPLKNSLWDLVWNLAKDKADTDLIFDISYERLQDIWNQYRPQRKTGKTEDGRTKGLGFHSLRHTVGVTLYQKHKNLKLVQQVLGHRSIQNTMIYIDVEYSTSELRKLL